MREKNSFKLIERHKYYNFLEDHIELADLELVIMQ